MRLLYLDLEATVIDHWNTCNYIESNIEIIKKVIVDKRIDEIGIYSYAMWSINNQSKFVADGNFDKLNAILDNKVLFKHIIQVPSMIEATVKINPRAWGMTLQDYWKFISKEHSMIDYVRVHHENFEYVGLVDDTLKTNFIVKIWNCELEFIPI